MADTEKPCSRPRLRLVVDSSEPGFAQVLQLVRGPMTAADAEVERRIYAMVATMAHRANGGRVL